MTDSPAKKAKNEDELKDMAENLSAQATSNFDFSTVYDVQVHSARGAYLDGPLYKKMYQESMNDPEKFWDEQAKKTMHWDVPYSCVTTGSFEGGDVQWFAGGKLNACVQCLDRHVWNSKTADKTALIWEGDEVGTGRSFTFRETLREVCKVANALKSFGVQKNEAVTVYLPMIPEVAFTMLACARLGAPHSVVFAGFSAESLRDRIADVKSKYVVVCDEGMRGGRPIALKKILDDALSDPRCAFVERVFVFKRTGAAVSFVPNRDVWMNEEVAKQSPYCPAELVDSEHTLFYLYTSGSTGKPKGLVHTTAGYLLYAGLTHKYVFDVRPGDVYACVADAGWITGHTYIIYGPLFNGSVTMIFESTPLYPNEERYWDLIQRHKVTQFYTAPTAIRALMRHGTDSLKKYDLSSLRVIGTVGEPIGPAPWKWYFEHVGYSRCAVVDTFWQTETGGIICTPLPGVTPLKPGSCCMPFFGIAPVLLDPQSGKELPFIEGAETSGVLCIKKPWPSITRTVNGDHERYMKTYFQSYKGYYLTGDGAIRDGNNYLWITGRVDDVLNVSGHRIGSAEIESAINRNQKVAESACVGFPHDIKGEGIAIFVILKAGMEETPELLQELKKQVRDFVGAFASADHIVITPGLPKTRSGKIMRRILRKIISNEVDQIGDTSTLADPAVVDSLVKKVESLRKKQ